MDGRFDCAEHSYGCETNPMKVDYFAAPPPNNGMHPTANSAVFMRETCFNSAVRRGG